MLGNKEILIINIALYVLTLLLYLRKKPLFSLGGIVLSLYTFVTIIAYFLFESPLSNFNDLHLFPFIYLYIVLLMIMRPLLQFNEDATQYLIIARSSFIKYLSIFLILLTFIVFAIKLQEGLSFYSMFDEEQLLQSYEDSHEDLQSMKNNNKFMIFNLLYYILIPFITPLFLYAIHVKNRKLSIFLGLSILLAIIVSFSEVSRTALLSYITAIPFVYICFAKKIGPKLQKRFKRVLVVSVIVVLFCFGSVTIARFGDSEEILIAALENYAGQSVLYFNNYGLDANGIRYGDRVAPVIRRFLGLKTSVNYYERRDTYSKMSIDDSYFTTFVGDFTLDFGPFYAFIILCCFAYMFKKILILHGKAYRFSQIFILYILYQWIVRGIFLWPYSEKTGNMTLIIGIMIYLILYQTEQSYMLTNNEKCFKDET